MTSGFIIANERQAREVEGTIEELDRALCSEQILKSIVEGLPPQVIEGVRRTLSTERRELAELHAAYKAAKDGEFAPLRRFAGKDPGAFLIVARITRGLSQKDLARKLGLREQAIQRWEAEKYRSISLSNYQKIARALGVRWQMEEIADPIPELTLSSDLSRDERNKILRHARANGWLTSDEDSDEKAISTLVRHIGDHVTRYGTPSLLRTGLRANDRPEDWLLLLWKAQVTRRAESIINQEKPRYRTNSVSWLLQLVQLSLLEDGPLLARDMLLEHGIVLVVEPQIAGMTIDGASFLADEVPVIGLTLLRDTLDNFWFTLLHEVAHIILHYRTGLSSGFFDDMTSPVVDGFEEEANRFAGNLLIPEEIWMRAPARISKTVVPIERFANQLKINSAIVFGRIRMERNDYSIFSKNIGRDRVRRIFFPNTKE